MRTLAGTRTLTMLALRRDRFMLPAWALTFVAVVGFSAVASKDLYRSTAELAKVSEAWNATTALVALHGRIYDPTSLGSGALVKMTGLGTAMVGLLAILLVIRHTRADEEVGRYELAAAGAVGRYAGLTAAVLVSTGTVVALGLLSGLSLVASGLPPAGSMVFAAAWIGTGFVFTAIGAVAAQLSTSARAARGLAAAVLAASYAVRAVGDTASESGPRWVSWLSPIGWAQQTRPFAGDRWWALLLPLLGGAAALGAAVALLRRRDLGAGLLSERPGAATGPGLVSPLALAWRLQRLALLGWTIGFAIGGVLVGSIAATITDLLDNPQFGRYLELLGGVSVLEDAFLSAELGIASVIAAGFGISAAMRMRAEEAQGRAEPLLATGVSRASFALAHLAMALGGTVVLVVVMGATLGSAHAVAVGDPAQVGRILVAALVRLPAVWLVTATVLALYGVAGRLASFVWVLLVGIIVVGEFGPLMELPGWTLDLSPFTHVPALPGGELEAAPLIWLTMIAAALSAIGLAAFRRRDVQPD